jgi:hypothetical protein
MIKSVFLSFAGRDREFGRRLLQQLSQQGIRVFENDIAQEGPRWAENLRAGLDSTDAMVAVLTDTAVRDGVVLSEVGAAMAAHKPIIWVIPRNHRMPTGLPQSLARFPILRVGKLPDRDIGAALRERLVGLASAPA